MDCQTGWQFASSNRQSFNHQYCRRRLCVCLCHPAGSLTPSRIGCVVRRAVLCCVTCVDLRHKHATHAICVSVRCAHSTSLIRVTASDGHIVGDMTGRFALRWRSDGPAHLLDLTHLEHCYLDSCRPQMFESMSVGPLSCLKVTAVWRAVDLHTAHASPRGSASRAFSLPCPARSLVQM